MHLHLELTPILTVGILVLGLVLLGGFVALLVLLFRPAARPASRVERRRNQSEVEEWIARTKGDEHVRRMRGE